MVKTDTIEGTVDQTMVYHYDVANDVHYLRLISGRKWRGCVHGRSVGAFRV